MTDIVQRWFWWVGSVLLATVFLVRSMTLFLGAGHDDVFIFLWSGSTLSDHSWFANVNGEPEDMLSSPLAGLLAWACVAWDKETSLVTFKLAGLFAAILCIPLTGILSSTLGSQVPRNGAELAKLWGLASASVVALTPSFSYWAMGGMETSFQALLLLGIAFAAYVWSRDPGLHRVLFLSVLCVLAVVVRIEGFWVPIAITITLVLLRRDARNIATITMLAVIPLMVFMVVGLARMHFTGAFWPNPVYAKAGHFPELVAMGARYLEHFALSSPLLFVLNVAPWGVLLALAWKRYRQQETAEAPALVGVAVLSALAIGQDCFVLLTGGNWMTHYRFLVPTIPLKAVILAYLAGRFLVTTRLQVCGLGVMACGVVLLPGQDGSNPNFRFFSQPTSVALMDLAAHSLSKLQEQMIMANQPHRRDELGIRPFIETQLEAFVPAAGSTLCLATYQSGYFPWLLRTRFDVQQIYVVDTFGLNNRRMALRYGAKDSLGLIDGQRIDLLVMQGNSELIEVCGAKLPDLIYMLFATRAEDRNLVAAGYQLIWQREGAVVYARRPPLS